MAATIFDSVFSGEIGSLARSRRRPSSSTGTRPGCASTSGACAGERAAIHGRRRRGSTARARCASAPTARRPGPVTDVSDRSYFREAIKTGKAFVSDGLTSRCTHRQVLVIAVPTRDAAREDRRGSWPARLLVKPTRPDQRTIDLGYSGLAILDRENQLVFSGFAHPRSLESIERFGKAQSGVLSDAPGLDGDSGHVVAFARSNVPQWTSSSTARAPRSSATRGAASSSSSC